MLYSRTSRKYTGKGIEELEVVEVALYLALISAHFISAEVKRLLCLVILTLRQKREYGGNISHKPIEVPQQSHGDGPYSVFGVEMLVYKVRKLLEHLIKSLDLGDLGGG